MYNKLLERGMRVASRLNTKLDSIKDEECRKWKRKRRLTGLEWNE